MSVRPTPLLAPPRARPALRPARMPAPSVVRVLVAILTMGVAAGCQVSVPLVREHLQGDVRLEAEGYRFDPRWAALEDDFQSRVGGALERLEVVTGLRFPAARVPEVVLRPLGDEAVPYELRARIVDGRRRVSLHINAEPLLGGTRNVDRVLLRALADAAYQDAAQRHGSVPRWLTELAGTVAAGELPAVLSDLNRRAFAGDREVFRLDGDDAAVAVQTAAAALVLLTERGQPDQIRHLLQSVSDGDDADGVMARLAHEPDGTWLRPAATSFRLRLSSLDDEPWRVLAAAEAALVESGGAGLEAALPAVLPLEVEDEIRVLRARAASAEGDFEKARRLLADLSPQAPARLRDPAGTLALRIRVESRPGGDADLARRLARELEADFPKSRARRQLRETHPLLGMQEDPQRWLRAMRAYLADVGTEGLDLSILERYTRILLQDHRAGAAERFLQDLGERGLAPELEDVRQGIEEAQAAPTQAARMRGAERVAAWREEPGEETWADVRDTGAPAGRALATLLESANGGQRRRIIQLMAETLGPEGMIDRVTADWEDNLRHLPADLDAIAAHAPYPALVARLDVAHLAAHPRISSAQAETYWQRMTYELPARFLETHPTFLQDVRAEAFAVRQRAFATLADEAPRDATPAFVARGLRDPAALLRREAVKLAGEVGFAALVRESLKDEAWFVREEAARAVVLTEGAACTDRLIELLRRDESVEVRGAAALGLLTIAPDEDRVVDALLATQVDEEVRLRDAISARLMQLDAVRVVRGIDRGWARALRRREPSRSYLFRTSLLFQRLTREDLGYYPGAPRAEVRGMHRRIQTWLAAHAQRGGGAGDLRLVRARPER